MDTLTVQVWKADFADFKSPAAKLVALALARRGRESGACWAKQATLADDCGISKQTVHRCIEELEAAGWLKRATRHRADGGRTSDIIWLTMPSVTLFTPTMDRKEAERAADMESLDVTTVELRHDTKSGGGISGDTPGPIRESTLKDSLKDSIEDSLVRKADSHAQEVDYPAAIDLIWQRASKIGRQRSSKADIEKGLRSAVARGHQLERVMRGLGAYFASQDATKDDGAYQRGAHVILASDRWASFLDDAQSRTDAGERTTPEAAAIQQDLGTLEAPSDKRARLWMELFSQNGPWDPQRGPQPGRLGCRVPDAIQREFGVEPYASPPSAADDAAFD